MPRIKVRPSGAQRLARFHGGTEALSAVGVSIPQDARTLIVENPLGANVLVLFDNRPPRRPGDTGGQDYDLRIPSTSFVVYPFPAGSEFVSFLVRYPAGNPTANDGNLDFIARWSPVLYPPSMVQNTPAGQ